MSSHICRCVTCPSCHSRYLVRVTPYANGATIAADASASDLFTLHCSCGYSHLFKLSQLQIYTLSESAYLRGYGSTHEIVPQARAATRKTG
jgi:hypothetical protein